MRFDTQGKVDDGPRGFAVIVQEIEDGALHAEISDALQKLNRALDEHVSAYETTARGELVIKLTLKAEPNGTVAVHGEVKTKTPPKRKRGQVFWLTKGNNLSPENPRQTKLPLRDVTPPAAKPIDVPAEAQPVRSV